LIKKCKYFCKYIVNRFRIVNSLGGRLNYLVGYKWMHFFRRVPRAGAGEAAMQESYQERYHLVTYLLLQVICQGRYHLVTLLRMQVLYQPSHASSVPTISCKFCTNHLMQVSYQRSSYYILCSLLGYTYIELYP